tara:strand:- start:5166 stop:6059 length:894 start_codon:yes stop_codon:yes gene_type:complete
MNHLPPVSTPPRERILTWLLSFVFLASPLVWGQAPPFLSPPPDAETEANEEGDELSPEDKINQYLQRLAETQKEERLKRMSAVIGDIDRVCQLSDEQKKVLNLAAKGATDKGLDGWRTRMDAWVRDRARHSDQDIDEFLSGVGNVRFGESRQWAPERQAIWTNSLKETLTNPQREAYWNDLKARLAFKHESMARVIVADLDRHLKFSAEQRSMVLTKMIASSEKYWERLEEWSGDEDNLPLYQMGALVGAISNDELKTILNENQLDGWQRYFARHSGVWDTIRGRPEPQLDHLFLAP